MTGHNGYYGRHLRIATVQGVINIGFGCTRYPYHVREFGTSPERGRKLEQLELMLGDARENLIDLKQAELMLDWCAYVLDTGSKASNECPMAKVAVSEALKGFHILPRRWVVERTFAWTFKNRRLVRAYEQITVVATPLITIAASAALLRRWQ